MSFEPSMQVLVAWGEWVAISTILLAAAKLATLCVRKSAALRHLIWLTAFAGLLLVPVLSPLLPTWTSIRVPVKLARSAPPTAKLAFSVSVPAVGKEAAYVPTPAPLTPEKASKPAPAAALPPPAPLLAPTTPARHPFGILIAVWLVGLAAVALRATMAWREVHGLYRASRRYESDSAELNRVANALGLKRFLSLRVNPGETPPTAITWGSVRPVVLLPRDSGAWSDNRRRVVLLHELAHVRRMDSLSQLISLAACALLWFNPLVWLCASAMRDEAETAADDAVLGCGIRPTDYAAELVGLAAELGRRRGAVSCIGVAMLKRSKIESRVKSIVDPSNQRLRPTFGQVSGVSIVGLLLVFLLTCVRPSVALREKVDQGLYEESLFVLTQHERSAHRMLQEKAATDASQSAARDAQAPSPSPSLATESHNSSPGASAANRLVAQASKRDAERKHVHEQSLVALRMPEPPLAPPAPPPPPPGPELGSTPMSIQSPRWESPRMSVAQAVRLDEIRAKEDEAKALSQQRQVTSIQARQAARADHIEMVASRRAPVLVPLKIQDEEVAMRAAHPECKCVPAGYQDVQTAPFTSIVADNAVTVHYAFRPTRSVMVPSGCVSVAVDNGVLHIHREGADPQGQCIVEVSSPVLSSFYLNGESFGEFDGIVGQSFSAKLDGCSHAQIDGAPGTIDVEMSGHSALKVNDRGRYGLTGNVDGSSTLETGGVIDSLDLKENGSSSVHLWRVVAQTASVWVNGSSSFAASGHAADLTLGADGSSGLTLDTFNAGKANVSALGSSRITLGSAHWLLATANGGAQISYSGDPRWLCKTAAPGSQVWQR